MRGMRFLWGKNVIRIWNNTRVSKQNFLGELFSKSLQIASAIWIGCSKINLPYFQSGAQKMFGPDIFHSLKPAFVHLCILRKHPSWRFCAETEVQTKTRRRHLISKMQKCVFWQSRTVANGRCEGVESFSSSRLSAEVLSNVYADSSVCRAPSGQLSRWLSSPVMKSLLVLTALLFLSLFSGLENLDCDHDSMLKLLYGLMQF